ncbi:MaoC/PaaZ C-terminal domain-containing protein [Rhodococcus rhodochrous]|uniref:MaoC/PaaZ C-terminal domain-containing protein n=1 Tax=Rhodococcus rhodochrous TaxID=1829 RepID=UPI001E5FE46C|nr:MaoC/PaaZ C-terminal domain-containing protein [Rhodococcus rhodochrous]MCD2098039.1 enoyl-CoA hydratase [Rhodococcus rhodochrous]MCD2122165.1 enoyl-CoA hydratase [Rhodococcus rhodochrous]MCQ4133894.1 enoyl-CoA hydratase [Rhodococcus rhodochrous]MDJ0019029.1 MaoC/PaaZ C-terminal domain-containing protein [Rhodococcus rhodochrous]
MTATTASPAQWRGHDLGTRTIAYDERDAILYALAVGASATDLDLVFEERLRVLPTFALTLAQWAPDALGELGAFDTATALHGSQSLEVLAPLPRSGEIAMSARVGEVWDKGRAAVFEVVVESEFFVATWSLFAPGAGGFGGERGPSAPSAPEGDADVVGTLTTRADQAALYRLTGDRHHIHIDPAAAARIGQPRPILHGLCTLAAATLPLADMLGAHPADLRTLFGRFAAPVFPGDTAQVRSWGDTTDARFDVVTQAGAVLSGGRAAFA